MSHSACVVYSVLMAGFSTGLFYAGISLGWLYLFMGVLISAAVLPAALTLLWKDQNWVAAAFTPIIGLCVSLSTWLATAKRTCGELTVDCTGSNYPMLAGNVAALLSPIIVIPVLTYTFGRQKYDWVSMGEIKIGDDSDIAAKAHIDLELTPGADRRHSDAATDAEEKRKLKKSAVIARTTTVTMTFILLVLWPMPLYGTGYIFSKKFFTGWVTVGIIWLFCSIACVGIYPVWQGRKTIAHTIRSMMLDLRGKYRPTLQGRVGDLQEGEEDQDRGDGKVDADSRDDGAVKSAEKVVIKDGSS